MNKKLKPVYFSTYGSYMMISHFTQTELDPADIRSNVIFRRMPEGIYLRSARGRTGKNKEVMRFIPLLCGKEAEISSDFSFSEVKVSCPKGEVDFTFANDQVMLVQGKGDKLNLSIDNMPENKFDYIMELPSVQRKAFVLTSYKTLTRYLIYSIKGKMELDQNYIGDEYLNIPALKSKLTVSNEDGEFLFAVREINGNMIKPELIDYDFDECEQRLRKDFEAFTAAFGTPGREWKETFDLCSYTLWSTVLKASGKLKKDMVMMSNDDATSAWAYDAGLTAFGLSCGHADLALNQITNFFDRMDEIGTIPGSINDAGEKFLFLKAPAQGFFLSRLLERIKPGIEVKKYLFDCLEKEIAYYETYKDSNQDGICEYHQGNEATLDNSTTFDRVEAIDSPCLTAYLIKAMDLLSTLAGEFDDMQKKDYWKKRADELMDKALAYFVVDNKKVAARITKNGEFIDEKALLPYMFVILGKRIPRKLRNNLINTLKNEFLAPYGLASEMLSSEKYEDNGYFRGPVWVQTTLPYIEGIEACGHPELAKEIAIRFCNAVRLSGSAENFDAKTGEGYYDPVNTTTSGVFMYLHNKFLDE